MPLGQSDRIVLAQLTCVVVGGRRAQYWAGGVEGVIPALSGAITPNRLLGLRLQPTARWPGDAPAALVAGAGVSP